MDWLNIAFHHIFFKLPSLFLQARKGTGFVPVSDLPSEDEEEDEQVDGSHFGRSAALVDLVGSNVNNFLSARVRHPNLWGICAYVSDCLIVFNLKAIFFRLDKIRFVAELVKNSVEMLKVVSVPKQAQRGVTFNVASQAVNRSVRRSWWKKVVARHGGRLFLRHFLSSGSEDFLFSLLLGEDFQFDYIVFFKWVWNHQLVLGSEEIPMCFPSCSCCYYPWNTLFISKILYGQSGSLHGQSGLL